MTDSIQPTAQTPQELAPEILRQQVAQRFITGYSGLDWGSVENQWFQKFLNEGLGGVILFRENIQDGDTVLSPETMAQSNWQLQQHRPSGTLPLFISVDQEGGQVERLPFSMFPSTVTPMALQLSKNPERAYQTHRMMGDYLAHYGFNVNYAPTLDVNRDPENPIIGVRSFGDDPQTVWQFGQAVMAAYADSGILAVAKHFPGHGNGKVDSHLALPTLIYSQDECFPFQQAVLAKVPMMMVNHGYYPALQGESNEGMIPASASPTVIQKLLRQELGYTGLVCTDDMEMGAMTQNQSPIAAALSCLRAGVDILLYRQSREMEYQILEAVIEALKSGVLSLEAHQESLTRIVQAKQALRQPQKPDVHWLKENSGRQTIEETSFHLAEALLLVQYGESMLPLQQAGRIWLIHPDRASIRNYAYDQPLSAELPELIRENYDGALAECTYSVGQKQMAACPARLESAAPPDVIVFIAFNSRLDRGQQELYQELKKCRVPIVLVSAGMPDDPAVLKDTPACHIALCHYRPQGMRALVKRLFRGTSLRGN